ncbi:MAG TPA: dihydroorotate dehydrogenase [Candidatus Cloacimonadota bacterium]|nr:dihydroorotate dehydrogenase [Candidatus Cloacimonadota bacterium]
MGTVLNEYRKPHCAASNLLETALGRIKLKTPLTVASGTFDLENLEFYDPACLGAFVTKTITRHPKQGNPPPRLYETEAGLINSIGLQNPGLDSFVAERLPLYRAKLRMPLVVSFSGSTLEEFSEILAVLEGCEGIAGYEVNVSCPNVENEGIAFGVDPDTVYKLTNRLARATSRELCVKLSPNVSDIGAVAQAAESAGATSLALINTLWGMAIDPMTGKCRIQKGIGGYSGIGIKPVALALTYKAAQAVSIPIVAMGGIYDWKDAMEFFWAGASAIALGTAHFVNPLAAPELIMGLAEYLLQRDMPLSAIIGKCK